MKPTVIIGLAGGAGSGKSTAAAFLEERYGAKRYAFADPLKRIAMNTLKFTRAQCYGTQVEKEAVDPRYGFSPRQFLQWLGTEGCRAVLGADFWWKFALDAIREDRPALAVIEDVRFPNEAKALLTLDERERGPLVGHVWRLHPAPDAPVNTTADATHASEAQVMTLPASAEVRPPKYGLEPLYSTLTYHAHEIGLRMVDRFGAEGRHADDCTCGSAYCG